MATLFRVVIIIRKAQGQRKKRNSFFNHMDYYITLDSVIQATNRTERIVERSKKLEKVEEEYKKFFITILQVHDAVRLIFEGIYLVVEALSFCLGTALF